MNYSLNRTNMSNPRLSGANPGLFGAIPSIWQPYQSQGFYHSLLVPKCNYIFWIYLLKFDFRNIIDSVVIVLKLEKVLLSIKMNYKMFL